MKKSTSVFLIVLAWIIVFQSCKNDKADISTDEILFNEIKSGSYTYYRGGAILSAAAQSPHGSFKLRFNDTAVAALADSTGELPTGSTFPNGSIIVKDVYTNGTFSLYAVMKKDPANAHAAGGWLWAEYKTDGTPFLSTANKGDGCISCHSGTPNRDLTRTFDLH